MSELETIQTFFIYLCYNTFIMSTYVIRHVEVKTKMIKKKTSYIKNIDVEKDGINEGDIISTWGEKDFRYFKYSNGEWIGVKSEEVPECWNLVEWYCETKNYNNEDDDDESVVLGGKHFIKKSSYVDNGGAIRDVYLGAWGDDYNLKNRGWPSDMSDALKSKFDKMSEKEYIHSKTYVTLSEWESLYDKLKERFMSKVSDAVKRNELKKIDQRLSNIEALIVNKKAKIKEVPDDDDDDGYYDSLEYLFNEDYYDFVSILSEINRAYAMQYNIFGYNEYSDIRIIYYMG